MSDALLTRIADALEGLLHHVKTGSSTPATGQPATPAAEPVKKPAKAAKTPTETAATPATPAAASASDVMQQAAETVIDLANNYSRDEAVAILTKYGASKVSQVKPADLAAVLAEAKAKIESLKASKANESLV